MGVLTARYLKVFVRDRRNLVILFAQVPVLALAIVYVFKGNVLDRDSGDPANAAQLLFLLSTTALWLGSIDASREIIKERSVFARERAIGVRISSYLASKVAVLFALTALQTLLLVAIVFGLRPPGEDAGTYALAFAILLATAFVSVAQGLIISASVSTEDQATSFLPLVLIPQLLFAGAIVPVREMSSAVEALSSVVFAQWSFAGVGSAIDMNARIAADEEFAALDRYGSSFFAVSSGETFLALGIFLAVFLIATGALLVRRSD